MGNIDKTVAYLVRNGIVNTYYAVKERLLETKGVPYDYAKPAEEILKQQREASKNPPVLISILVPVYETPERFLRELIDSCLDQTYPGFELVLADASLSADPQKVIESYNDERIKYVRLNENKGISANTNEGLKHVSGDYTALVDHDDLLTEDALFEVVACILKSRAKGVNPVLIYSDEDKCDGEGKHFFEPNIKSEFNLDRLLSNNYICHLSVFETGILKETGFRPEFDGAQDHDVILRVAGKVINDAKAVPICHIPKVLYHWRSHEHSTSTNPSSKYYAYEAGKRAVSEYTGTEVKDTKHLGFYHAEYNEKLFKLRPKIGAVGGFISEHGKITGGVYDPSGEVFCQNMNKHFSGPNHTADSTASVYALDIRNLTPNPKLSKLYGEALYGYVSEVCKIKSKDLESKRSILWKWNKFFAEKAHESGYTFLFDPEYDKGKDYGYPINDGTLPVSVVIPNYNGIDYLKPCLDSIYALDDLPFEIIVVDNGSSDNSPAYIKENYPDVFLIEHGENLGFTGAVNHGIAVSAMPYVFLLNNDTTVEKDCILNLYKAMSEDKRIFSAGALMLSMDKPKIIDNAGDSYNLLGYARSKASGKSRFNTKLSENRAVFSSCAGAAMYNRDALRSLGPFDDRHFAYLEDVDMGYRARIYGYKNINVPSAVVFHKGSASSGSKHNAFKVSHSSQNAMLVAFKNQPFLQFIFNLPFIFCGIIIKSVFFSVKGLGGHYIKGTFRGIGMSLSKNGIKHHVKFRFKNMWNYLKIQCWIIRSTL